MHEQVLPGAKWALKRNERSMTASPMENFRASSNAASFAVTYSRSSLSLTRFSALGVQHSESTPEMRVSERPAVFELPQNWSLFVTSEQHAQFSRWTAKPPPCPFLASKMLCSTHCSTKHNYWLLDFSLSHSHIAQLFHYFKSLKTESCDQTVSKFVHHSN